MRVNAVTRLEFGRRARPDVAAAPREDGSVWTRLPLLGAAVLWSTAGAAIKLCGLSAWQISCGRSLVAALFMLVVAPSSRARPTWRMAAFAAAYSASATLFVLATKLTSAASAIFLQDTAPMWVLLLSPWLIGEKASRSALAAVPVYAVGLGLFFFDDLTVRQLAGNIVAVASGIAFAISILLLRALPDRRASALVWGNLLAAAIALPGWSSGPSPTTLDGLLLVYLGVFQLGLAYLLFARGIARTPAVDASFLILLEPVLNPLWTLLVTGERPRQWAVIGGIIVLAATAHRILAPPHGFLVKGQSPRAPP